MRDPRVSRPVPRQSSVPESNLRVRALALNPIVRIQFAQIPIQASFLMQCRTIFPTRCFRVIQLRLKAYGNYSFGDLMFKKLKLPLLALFVALIAFTALVFPTSNANAQQGCRIKPQIMLFQHINYDGWVLRLRRPVQHLKRYHDQLSSFVVIAGRWQLCVHTNYRGRCRMVGPGFYPWVSKVGICNDCISSVRPMGCG